MNCLNDQEWNELLASLEAGRLIPVVGDQILRSDVTSPPLSVLVAEKLAARLKTEWSDKKPSTLNDVVAAYLAEKAGARLSPLYSQVRDVVTEMPLQPPEHLSKLARITDFNLFLTTSFAPTLENSLNEVRFGSARCCEARQFSIKGCADLPDWKEHLGTCVFYLLGKAEVTPRSFVIWDADAIDAVLHFHDLVNDGKSLPHLQKALKEFDLLFLGVNFSDWFTRFLLRVARQERHATDTDYSEYLAERSCDVSESFIGYCRGARRGTKIIQCEPIAFVETLFDKWTARQAAASKGTNGPRRDFVWPERKMPKGAIFLSYAHEDVLAAQRVADDLRQAGCDVWLDRERLGAGENWENTLEIQVKKQCSVFISLISCHTEKSAGYCHRERKWAADRDPDFGKDGSFYVPVTIDETKKGDLVKENLPGRSINVWALLKGATTPEFVARIGQLQKVNQTGGVV